MPKSDAVGHLIHGFVGEASDLCEALTRDLLALERGAGDIGPIYENLARGLHTLKGSAGTLGLLELEQLSHRLESAVLPFQAGRLPLPSKAADAVLRGLDSFMFLLRAHAAGRRGASLVAVEESLVLALPETSPDARESEESGDPIDEAMQHAEPPVVIGGPQTWRVAAAQVTALMTEVERLRLIRLRLEDRRRDLARARSGIAASWRGPESNEIQGILIGIDAATAADGQDTADIVDALEQGVKDIGTQPVRVVVEPLHRAVRDLCRASGKDARLSLVGGEIRLDRRVLEALKGPLVHLIRNAVVHGIETCEERRRRGKHEEGTIVIRVEQQGNVVFIEVNDDGGGINLDAIRRAALEKQVVTEAELARLDPAKVRQLIFLPTVSTAQEATATSGRGVGMDAVKRGVDELHGNVEVQSIEEQGTRILLTFPASLGSSPILVVRVDEQDVGIPLLSIEAIAAARPSSLQEGAGETRFIHGDELLPIVELGVVLGLRHPRGAASGFLLLLHSQARRIALAVDEVMGDMDLVIRPLPREVAHIPMYQGASSLARGELVLIVRPDWLVASRGISSGSSGKRNALVVDDSLTARTLHRAMLEAGGYTVHATSGARQALERLRYTQYDVILCDIAMYPVDGLDFMRALRAQPGGGEVPVLAVSARDGDMDRTQSLAAGADGFLRKADCARGRLVAELDHVIAHRKGVA